MQENREQYLKGTGWSSISEIDDPLTQHLPNANCSINNNTTMAMKIFLTKVYQG